MKKIILLSFVSITLWSCNAETEAIEENKTTTEQTLDTTQVEPEFVEEEIAKVADFSKIEHYAIFDTKSKLVENFGKENIKDGSSWFGEGSLELKHSVLTNPSNGHIVKYVWEEDNPEKLAFIEIYGNVLNKDFELVDTQKIGTECGLYTGMTVKEMKAWNGEDFSFSGFGWDFHGHLRPADGSKIANSNLSLSMDLKYEEGNESHNGLYGDIELSTADPLVLNAPITLDHITLFVD
jgi:hypothetical protein